MDTKKNNMIVEDNDLYRAALKDLINAQDHLEVVAEVGSGEAALKTIKRFPANLVLLDLRLPGASGYDVLREISPGTETKVLVLTILESDHSIKATLDAGADGYCFKDVSSAELINAKSRVLSGERYVSQAGTSYPLEQRTEQRQPCDCTILWSYFNRENFVSARMLKTQQVLFQVLAVVGPPLAIDSGSAVGFNPPIGCFQPLHIQIVIERREHLLRPFSRYLRYPLLYRVHVF